MHKSILRMFLLISSLIIMHDPCEAKKVSGYMLTEQSDTIYGDIKVREFNTVTGGYTIGGINLELLHIEVSFKGYGEKSFHTYLPEDILGFGFQYDLTDYTFRRFILESKSISRNARRRYRFLSLEYEGQVSLYKDLIRVNNTPDMTRGTSYVYGFYYLFSDLIGLKKVEIRNDMKSIKDLLEFYGFENDYLEEIPADANPKDIKTILEEYDAWHVRKELI